MGFDDNKQAKTVDPIENIKDLVQTKMVAQKNLTVGKKEDQEVKTGEEQQSAITGLANEQLTPVVQ